MATILFLTKRYPQGRCLLRRPYGRFHFIPHWLAMQGHEVHVAMASLDAAAVERVERQGMAVTTTGLLSLGASSGIRALGKLAESIKPRWITGFSDAWTGVLAHRLARRTGARLAIDAYDNYESYMPWNLPLHMAWRRAVRAADCVTAAGPQLAGLLQSQRRGGAAVEVLPMAADPGFVPRDRTESRVALGLPTDRPLVGYVGSWSKSRDSELLLDMFRIVREHHPRALLVMTGKLPAEVKDEQGVVAVGYLPDESLPLLVSALDVACVMTANTPFGRYSYPVKLCEAMACRVPVVASGTDAVRWMLQDQQVHLAQVGDPADFAERVLGQLAAPRVDYPPQDDWPKIAKRFERLLTEPRRRT